MKQIEKIVFPMRSSFLGLPGKVFWCCSFLFSFEKDKNFFFGEKSSFLGQDALLGNKVFFEKRRLL